VTITPELANDRIRRRRTRSFAPIILAFATIAAGFLASTFYGEIRASQIDREAALIATNSLPGVERLVAAESALRHLEVAAEEYAHDSGDERRDAANAIDVARANMARELSTEALMTETYASEADQAAAAGRALVELDTLLARMCEISSSDRAAGRAFFEHYVRSAAERTDAALDRLLSRHAVEVQAQATRISLVRASSIRLAFGLDAMCVVFSAGAAFVAIRALKNQQAVERAHEEMLQTRAEDLESFARRVAHDLLSPLSALSFTLSSVKRNRDRGVPIDEPLERAVACLKRSQRLVDAVLDFARSAASLSADDHASLREAIDGVIDEVRSDKGSAQVEVVVLPWDDDVVIPSSPGILASVVSNLVRNAVKYIGDGDQKRVIVRVLPGKEDVRVEVEDTGPGLPPDVAQHVFEPGFRAANNTKPGLGLGLATVRRFVEAHHGRVGVQSALGRGSVFWFQLPRVPASVPMAAAEREVRV